MKKINGFSILLMTTILMVVLMLVTIKAPKKADEDDKLLFPDLLAKLNTVDTIYVTSAQDTFTLLKKDNDWFIDEYWGYPADFNLVKRTLIDIAEAKILERKTKKSDQHVLLGVEGSKAGGASLQITLADGDKKVASLLLGNERVTGQQVAGTRQFYVRDSKSDQVWLAEGYLNINRRMFGWIKDGVIDIARERIAKVSIIQPNGETATLINLGKKDTFGTPAMREQTIFKYKHLGYDIAGTLFGLTMEDVKPVLEFSRGGAEVVKAEFITFDGLKVIAHTSFNDGKYYATFRAEKDESMMTSIPPDIEKMGILKTPSEVQQEITTINRDLQGWVYQFGGFVGTNMMRAEADIVVKPDNVIPMPADLTGTQ